MGVFYFLEMFSKSAEVLVKAKFFNELKLKIRIQHFNYKKLLIFKLKVLIKFILKSKLQVLS